VSGDGHVSTGEHQPALDGLRGVAVLMVLAFHGGAGWMTGGYVGVSVFFTLSGFLITSVLLREHDRTGTISVRSFAARRARRLLPASFLCLVGVAVLARAGLLDGVADLRRDLIGSLLQVQNWVLLGSGESYTELLAARGGQPSPLEHFWSLAIEEQVYWVWPWAVLAVMALRPSRRTASVVGVAVVGALAAPVFAWRWGPDAAYWATPARLGELLIGAVLAFALARRPNALGAVDHAGPPALAAIVAAAVVLPADGGPAYAGWLPVLALVTATLLAATQVPGATRSLLSVRPLVAVGTVSYGLYLYHWPVYVVLDAERTGLGGSRIEDIALAGLRLTVTAAVAVLSFVLVERPVRRATWTPGVTFAGAGATLAVAVVTVLAVTPLADDGYWRAPTAARLPAPTDASRQPLLARAPVLSDDRDDRDDGAVARPTVGPSSVAGVPWSAALPSRPVRVVVAGDSTAESLGVGLSMWSTSTYPLATVAVATSPGCGFLRGGVVASDGDVPFRERCDDVLDDGLPATLAAARPDVVLLMVTERDLLDRTWSDDEGAIGPDDPRFRARLVADYTTISDAIHATGAVAVWTRAPDVQPYWRHRDTPFIDPARRAVVDEVMDEVAAANGATVLDLRGWLPDALATDHEARPDGVHWTPEAAATVARAWLGPQLVRIALGADAGGAA
jgi:peptidoglycan/LPS O-acetylase OafA/YrhL